MNFITLTNLEMNLDNSFHSKRFLTTVIGDSSAKSKEWSKGDRSTMEWSQIKFINFQFRRCKIMKQQMRGKLFFLHAGPWDNNYLIKFYQILLV